MNSIECAFFFFFSIEYTINSVQLKKNVVE